MSALPLDDTVTTNSNNNTNISINTTSNKGSRKSITMQSPRHIFDSNLYDTVEMSEHSKSEQEGNTLNVEPIRGDAFPIDYEKGIFSLKWSPDGSLLAAGCADGGVRLLNKEGKLVYRLQTSGNLPVTSVAWRPSISGVGSNTLVTASSNGSIDHWHVPSQKTIYSIVEQNNQIFCLDYTHDGTQFSTAGKDKIIRIYDEKTKQEITRLETGVLQQSHGHSNRIFSLRYKPDDKNVLLSGSWDNTMLFWDVRAKTAFRSVYGPHIAGHTIDIQNDIVVTGSWRVKNSIQSWEFKTGKLMNTINWSPSPMIYTCHFCPSMDGIIATGGTGINELRIINIETGVKSKAVKLPKQTGIYTLAWDPTGNSLAFAGDSRDIQIIKIKQVKTKEKNSLLKELLSEDQNQ